METANGYMEKETFRTIIRDYFIPYVNNLRKNTPDLRGKRAALIVDGHSSRYDIDTLILLLRNDIDFIILVSHSSHLTQPLDRRLTGLIKVIFSREVRNKLPPAVLQTLVNSQSSQVNKHGAAPVGKSGAEPVVKSSAEYERTLMVWAVIQAIHKALTPGNILSAWLAAHLHPYNTEPPYSKKDEEDLRQQITTSGVNIEKRKCETRRVTSIIGLINSPRKIAEIRRLIEGKQLKARNLEITRTKRTSTRIVEEKVYVNDESGDLGDYITDETDENGNVICDSDAVPYISERS